MSAMGPVKYLVCYFVIVTSEFFEQWKTRPDLGCVFVLSDPILRIYQRFRVMGYNLKLYIGDRLGPDIFWGRDPAQLGPGTGNGPGSGPFLARW
jgi:hypothetical protein